jgi:signal transduction histidine kinase
VESALGAYCASVVVTDSAVSARRGPGDGLLGRARPANRPGEGWRGWFVPTGGRRARLVDVRIALVIASIQVAGTIVYSHDEPSRWAFDAFAYVLLVIGPVALLFRRGGPEATLAVAFAAAAAYAASGYPRGPAGFPAFAFAMVSAIMMGRHAFAWGVLVVGFPSFMWLPSLFPDEEEASLTPVEAAEILAWLPLVGAAAEITRIRGKHHAERAHAEREEARRRASEERLRIARELHDVLAHNISLIGVQSGVALHLLDERPEHARPALEAINEASEEALRELQSVLDVLNRGLAEDGSGEWAPRAPAAGVRDLDGLVRRTRAAGVDVRLTVEGEAWPLPTEVDLAAFRIVQEALTNVVRHAGRDAGATVRLAYSSAELVVRIDDDGRGAGSPGSQGAGHGIAGMRERVHASGGTFAAGPRPGRGFRVNARFPLHEGPR